MLRQRNMAQMKEQIKTPEKELRDEEIDNLSDAEFKTMVIRMLTELIELGCKMKEKMKAIQSEIKKNIQGNNSEGKETRTQVNDLEQKEEIKIQLKQNEESRIQKKMRRGLGTYGTTLLTPTSESQGCQKEKNDVDSDQRCLWCCG